MNAAAVPRIRKLDPDIANQIAAGEVSDPALQSEPKPQNFPLT